jgi:steroid delta-isomerase-like uncharacterized protein
MTASEGNDRNKDVVRRFYEDAPVGRFDHELIADDIVYHGPPMLGELRGRAAFGQVMGAFRSAFPGFQTSIEDMVAEGDRVAVRHTHYATHTGAFAGVPPTGRQIAVPGIEVLRVRDGQIAEFWHQDDFLGMLQQLGVAPAVGAGA